MQTLWVFYISHGLYLTQTRSYCGRPVALASSGSFEPGNSNKQFFLNLDLTPADLQVDSSWNPQSLRFFIKHAKTDPFWRGCFIFLGLGSAPLCPVSALISYIYFRGPGIGPLFIFQEGHPLLRTLLQSTLQAAGVPGKFSGHSFRIGAATMAAQRGVPDHLIKTKGRWSSEAYLCMCANMCTPSFW